MVGAGLVAAGVLVWMVAALPFASGQTVGYANIEAPTMTGQALSDHNNNTTQACGTFVALNDQGEQSGDLVNSTGSYLGSVQLPQGATVTDFNLFANDGDLDTDVHAFLLRKHIVAGLQSPSANGLATMADAHSSGSVVSVLRRFHDHTIHQPIVDNSQYSYFVELVDCGIPEPFAMQVVYTTP